VPISSGEKDSDVGERKYNTKTLGMKMIESSSQNPDKEGICIYIIFLPNTPKQIKKIKPSLSAIRLLQLPSYPFGYSSIPLAVHVFLRLPSNSVSYPSIPLIALNSEQYAN
jgi:hypothetical protein